MAYVPPALRKKAAQASSPDGTLGKTAGSDENLPPGMAPRKSVAERLYSQDDIFSHYWDPQNEGKHLTESLRNTLNASPEDPDRLKYIVLFRNANPRWESHGVIFVKSKLGILPGGERFREEQLDEAGATPARESVKSEPGRGDHAQEDANPTGDATAVTGEVPCEKSHGKDTQVSDESQFSEEQQAADDKQGHDEKTEPTRGGGKKIGSAKDNKPPNPEPEPPYSPDLSLYPLDPIAVFEQALGGYGKNTRFRFAGYHKIASLEFLPPHSRELFQLLEQKWTQTDRRGRVRQAQRSAESWKASLKHRWAVIQMEKDQDANEKLAPPEIEVRDETADASAGKSVKELLAEMRLKG